MSQTLKRILQGATLPVTLLLFWWLHGRTSMGLMGLFPSPEETWHATRHLWQTGWLGLHIRVSVLRVLWGFSMAFAVAVPLGYLLGWLVPLRPWLLPTLHFLRQIPPVAWIPLFLLWFGIGEGSKHAVIFYAAFFPIFLNTMVGVEQIPRHLWEVGRSVEFRVPQTLMYLIVPGSAVYVLSGLRLGLGMSWRALVAAEMLAASSGLGYLIHSARALVRVDEMVVGMLTIGVIGLVMEYAFVWIERKLLPWNQGVSGSGRRRFSHDSRVDLAESEKILP